MHELLHVLHFILIGRQQIRQTANRAVVDMGTVLCSNSAMKARKRETSGSPALQRLDCCSRSGSRRSRSRSDGGKWRWADHKWSDGGWGRGRPVVGLHYSTQCSATDSRGVLSVSLLCVDYWLFLDKDGLRRSVLDHDRAETMAWLATHRGTISPACRGPQSVSPVWTDLSNASPMRDVDDGKILAGKVKGAAACGVNGGGHRGNSWRLVGT